MNGQELENLPPVVAIVGPTAVGKSTLALDLAHRFGADIVTADSRQVYRYMDIGTAKPSTQDRAAIDHFMLDLVPPDQAYSAHLYRQEALAVLHRIARRSRVALLVGGTGFYIKALLDRLSLPPVPPNPKLRRELRQKADRDAPSALHEQLMSFDPSSAERIHPNNVSRLIRALEVVDHLKGPVPSGIPPSTIPALFLGLSLERDLLRQRIDARVLAQMEAGLLSETELLLDMRYSPETPSLQGFGYRQMVDHLAGKLSLSEAIGSYQTATGQYVRRQMTWFRADQRIQWLDAAQQDTVGEAARLIDRYLSSASSPA